MSTPVSLIRRLIASAAIACVAASIPSTVALARFTDVDSSTQSSTAIEALQGDGILHGYPDGSFKANAKINRAEFLKIVLESRGNVQDYAGGCFPDVQEEWFTKYVCTAMQEEIVSGYPDGLFHPGRDINFVEAAKILSLAYRQTVEQGSEWYEGYARAIESSKGIPPSIDKLDKQITRGEMAEMMWRLREHRTDQPAKGYLNVKYPELKVNLAADTPQRASSCADIRAFSEEASRMGMGYSDGVPAMRNMMESDGIAAPTAADSAQKSYSQTNVQVAGVDESDIVKTDGDYIYMIRGSEVRIVRVGQPTNLEATATISFGTDGFTPSELYIDGDRLVILGQQWNAGAGPIMPMMEERMLAPSIYPYSLPKAEVRIYDISDRTNPKVERTVSFDGSALTSRRIEDKLYLVINQPVYWARPIPLQNVRDEDLLPKVTDSANGEKAVAGCADVMILPHVPAQQYLTIGVIPLRSPTGDVKSEVILGSAENVYASLNNLYVATTEQRYYWGPVLWSDTIEPTEPVEKTNLYRFAFADDGADLRAQGSVPGHALNQFSMDEHKNTFRIATTTNEQWTRDGKTIPSTNALYVLTQDLNIAGSIEDMAPGERIFSVRFIGDRAYMVTFRQIDPLFVIDVSSPINPRILGKLKIPGYSDYLHPYDEHHIIGFGKETVEAKDQSFAWYQGMKIAIFDVRDVENPRELFKTVIGDRGTESPLLYNHKALLFEPERNLLSFPVSVAQIPDSQKNLPEGQAYGSPVFQGAYVYNISLENGFQLRGKLTHYPSDTFKKAGDYMYGYGKDVERVLRVNDSFFTIGQDSVRSYNLGNMDSQDSVTFPQEEPQPIPLYR